MAKIEDLVNVDLVDNLLVGRIIDVLPQRLHVRSKPFGTGDLLDHLCAMPSCCHCDPDAVGRVHSFHAFSGFPGCFPGPTLGLVLRSPLEAAAGGGS